jgi:hypothetical protein
MVSAPGGTHSHLRLPTALHPSCDLLIIVAEAADAVVLLDLADLGRRGVGKWP